MTRKTVCVDLDGTLARYDGWKGVDHIGDPIPGAVLFTKALGAEYRVVIYTTRCKATMPFPDPERLKILEDHEEIRTESDLATHLSGIVKSWLDEHGFHYDEIDVGQGKPIAVAYVDDRAVACVPQGPEGAEIAFKYALLAVRRLANKH